MRNLLQIFLITLLVGITAFQVDISAQVAAALRIDASAIKKDLHYLAGEETAGRGPGQLGEQLSATYIAAQLEGLGLHKPVGDSSFFHKFGFSYASNPHATAADIKGEAINVLAYLDNGASSTIVIGAHYDHLGRGEFGNIRKPDRKGEIHYGADDNASGVSGVLALARYFAQNDEVEPFNFLFAFFSAEELGLIGSKKMIEDSLYNWSRVNYMINMDMIGRFDEEKRVLHIHGVGTSPSWGELIEGVFKNKHAFNLAIDSSGVGPSDFTSFYLADIPVLSFYTGAHEDYHTPDDTPDKINYEGQAFILDAIVDMIGDSEAYGKLDFQKTAVRQTGRTSFKVTLGVMPDYAWQEAGLKIDGVTEGRSAEKAGIQAGDIVLSIGEVEIKSIQDYMSILGSHEKGDKVDALIMRNGKEMSLTIEF